MKTDSVQLNLVFAWVWMLLGFLSGMVLGLFFHKDNWLGGYGSFKRRMYRLGHISFFGLGAVNLMFWLTVQKLTTSHATGLVVSWAFIIGGITMPLCCAIMANLPKARMIFAVPVVSLIVGGIFMLAILIQSPAKETATVQSVNHQFLTANPP